MLHRRASHNSVDEGDELLFLLLPLDEVSFDQRLQLGQILLLTLSVDVLSKTNAADKAEKCLILQPSAVDSHQSRLFRRRGSSVR